MKTIRRSEERGIGDHGWLKSHHTFSFADYYDPRHMGFSALRVINEDRVAPGRGFGAHPHKNMEIISYVLAGELAHKDSMGNVRIVKANEFQYMSAGSGVTHSEFNPSDHNEVHFLQIWIEPKTLNTAPTYSELAPAVSAKDVSTLIASPDGYGSSIKINQDAKIHLIQIPGGQSLTEALSAHRNYYLHVIDGKLSLGSETLKPGDAFMISEESTLPMTANTTTKALLFDLP
jgi:redox-sensitive bicupin YhaK (pirin superfamily)